MSQNNVDSLLTLSSGSNNTIELSETGQGEIPRKKDQAREELQQRIEAKIVKLKRLIAFSLQQFEATFTYSLDDEKIDYSELFRILDTLNDRYEDKEDKLEKIETLINKIWEEEYGEEIATTLYQLEDIFMTIFFINTQETQYYFDNT